MIHINKAKAREELLDSHSRMAVALITLTNAHGIQIEETYAILQATRGLLAVGIAAVATTDDLEAEINKFFKESAQRADALIDANRIITTLQEGSHSED